MVALEEVAGISPHLCTYASGICRTEILSIGNELLTGKTLNTNERWLARRVTELGGSVARATTVKDNLADIKGAVEEILRRKPTILLTSGGLGPTFDDMTLQAIAKSTGRPLSLHKSALRMVRAKYHTLRGRRRIPLTRSRMKMAMLPEGAQALPNAVGTAPGVLLPVATSKIICLPGVPTELKRIFRDSVAPIILQETGGVRRASKSLRVQSVFESELAPLIERVMNRNPGVYIKSHPKGGERRGHSEIELDFIAEFSSKITSQERIQRAIEDMARTLPKTGKII